LYAINAPLLLLSKDEKQLEFCRWLLEDASGLTLEEKRLYQFYLIEYNLISDEEVKREMKYELFGPPNHEWIFEELEQRPEDERERFIQIFLEKMLHADSPVEAARKLLKTEEQRRQFLDRIQQEGNGASDNKSA
jgi:FMN phosphatase YigB (HAD superfamily)